MLRFAQHDPKRRTGIQHVSQAQGSPEAPGGFRPWGRLAGGDAEQLDAPVLPLVLALNALAGIRTVFSCGGHPEEADSVARGRRQAHVDVVVRDREAWQSFVWRCRKDAPAAVRALGVSGVSLRVSEGELGPVPGWLTPQLEEDSPLGTTGDRRQKDGRRWWRSVFGRRLGAEGWRYRRIVFEPYPYAMEAGPCRQALDAALQAATQAASSSASAQR